MAGRRFASSGSSPVLHSSNPGRSLYNAWQGGYQSGWNPSAPAPSSSPAPAAPAASSPAAPAQPSGPIEDSLYTRSLGANQQSRDSLLASLTNQQNQLGLNYGITFNRGAVDPYSGLATLKDYSIADNVDVTNPFSQAALLKRAYQQRQAYNTGSLASQGQLYSGYLQTKQDQAGFDNQQGIDSLLKQFASQYGNTIAQAAQARSQYDQANLDAYAGLLDRQPAPVAAPVQAPAPPPVQQQGTIARVLTPTAIRNSPYLSSWAKRNALRGR